LGGGGVALGHSHLLSLTLQDAQKKSNMQGTLTLLTKIWSVW